MKENKSKVLALKYRPQTFNNLIGQELITETITNSIRLNKIPNAYLFNGIRGVGKTTIARIIAKALNCSNGIEKMCENKMCENCYSITNSNHIDVLEMDAASKTGIDDVRSLIEFSRYGPTSAKYKIFIVDEVHMLSKQAFAALLKTLEEPPKYLKFIFATTELRKIPVTVLSRCQRFDLTRIKSEVLLNFLKNITQRENGNISDDALKLIVKISEGSVRDSLSLLDRALITQSLEKKQLDLKTVQNIFGYFDKSHLIEIINLIFQGKEKEVILKYRNISDQGVDPKIFLNDFLEILYYIKNFKVFGKNEINFSLNDKESNEIELISKEVDNETLIMFYQFSLKIVEELNNVVNQNLSIEMFLIRLIYLKTIPNLDSVLNNIKEESNLEEIENKKSKNFESKIKSEDKDVFIKPLKQIKNIVQEKKEDISKYKHPSSFHHNDINEFKNLIEICSIKKEPKLKYELEKNVRLVKFENGFIEIEFSDNLPKDFIKNLSNKLIEWTGKRWIITLSKNKGMATEKETKIEEKKNNLEKAKETDVYKKTMKFFSDAKLTEIDDLNN